MDDEKCGTFWKGKADSNNNKCKLGFINILNTDNLIDYSVGSKILSMFTE